MQLRSRKHRNKNNNHIRSSARAERSRQLKNSWHGNKLVEDIRQRWRSAEELTGNQLDIELNSTALDNWTQLRLSDWLVNSSSNSRSNNNRMHVRYETGSHRPARLNEQIYSYVCV